MAATLMTAHQNGDRMAGAVLTQATDEGELKPRLWDSPNFTVGQRAGPFVSTRQTVDRKRINEDKFWNEAAEP
ncbi:hypothetical protein Ct61P_00794 [Colletotrichum tofieldiae]|nr:hypothetical protein Ct61P_00794 [Colletotrichum tofieldiae]